jgi:transposase
MPEGLLVHVVLDNYGSRKHPRVRAGLARHPQWTFHFTPTSASWLNAAEGFFAKLTRRRFNGACSAPLSTSKRDQPVAR